MYLVAFMYTYIFIVKIYFNYFNLKYWVFVCLNWKSNTKIFWKLLCLSFDYVYQCDYVSNTGEEDSPHVKSYSGTPTTFPQHISHLENWRISLDSFLKRKNVRWTKNWNSNLLRLLMEIHEAITLSNYKSDIWDVQENIILIFHIELHHRFEGEGLRYQKFSPALDLAGQFLLLIS